MRVGGNSGNEPVLHATNHHSVLLCDSFLVRKLCFVNDNLAANTKIATHASPEHHPPGPRRNRGLQ